MAIIPAIQTRRSIRKFEQKKISHKMVDELLKAAMFSPSAKSLRPWEFIVVNNPQHFVGLTPYTWALETAPLAIVIIADTAKSRHWLEDCSVAAENIMLQAAELGLGTCWVHVHVSSMLDAEPKLKKILNIPENYGVLCMMAVGFPAEKKQSHSNKEFDKRKIHTETFQKPVANAF